MLDIGSGSGSGSAAGKPDTRLSCAAKNIQGPVELPYHNAVLIVARSLLCVYYFLVLSIGTSLNLFVVYLVYKFKHLRNLEFAIAVQIASVNTVGSVLTAFISLMSATANEWLLGEYVCIIVGAVHLAVATIRGLLMTTFVIDRFLKGRLKWKFRKLFFGLNMFIMRC